MYLISWEEGVEGPEGLLLAKKIKSYIYRLSRCFAQGSPEKAMKCFFVRKGGSTRINDNECLRG
jgi:hypothetical protein